MADGANLELNISASQDASVHQTFTALTKLLEKLNKRLGSLNSSIEKLVGDNTKLKKSNDAVTASVDKTTASIDKQSAVSEKAAKKAEKDAERIAKAKEREAKRIEAANKKAEKEAERAAERERKRVEQEQKRLAKEAERAEREADRLLEKERRRRDQEIKQQERDADRLAKLEAKNKRDLIKNNYGDPVTSKTYMTNQHDTFNMMDMYHRKLEQINREDERGTKIHGDKLIALQRTEDAFQKLLRPIDEAVKRKTAITDTLEKLMEFRDAHPESVSPQLNSHIDNLLSKVDKLGSVTNRQAFFEIADSFDFNRVFEKNLKAVQKSHIFTETEKHIQELGKFGSHTIDIYKNITKNMEDGSQQRAIAFRDVKQFGKWVEDNINTMSANIATLYSAESPDYARIEELKARKDAFEDMAKSIGKSQQTFDKFRSSFKDDLLPITSVQKHTDDLVSKHGEQAKTLFNFLNEGLDENSKRIKQNANAVTTYFTEVEKEKAKVEADLREKLTERASAKGEDQIKALDKGIDTLRHRVAELQHSLSDEGVIEAFLGKKSGRTAAFKSLNELMGSIPMFKKRIDEIRNSTEHGSVEQREAINKLKKDFTEYNKVLGTTSQLTAIASSNLEHLKRNNAASDVIQKHQTVVRELEGIRKNLANTFSGVSDFGASANISNLMRRFSGMLTSDSVFGAQARGLFADVDVSKLGALKAELEGIHAQYNKVIPTINKFAEVNGLSAEQVAKLNSAEFIQQASFQKTKDGVRKLAEEYLGFHKTSRTSITLFDRMASSMGNMARYAFGASIYYAFENAIFSTIDAVAQFDQSLKNLQAITDATDDDVAMLGDEIKRVAVETRYGINEVAEGATLIGQAGYTASETMMILNSVMQLAQGSMSTVTASADLLTTVLSSFNMNATDAAMVADNMAAAMNYSKLDIDKLRTAFNYVGPVAMDAGVSLQEMSSILMVLANNGMKASTIGTSLRNVFSQLQSPSAGLRKAFSSIDGGEEKLAKLADKSVPVVDKFRILNESLGTSSDLFKLFGLRAAGTVSILMKFPEQIQEMLDGLYTLGEAERMADKQMEGLANRIANLGASLEVLGVTVMEQPSGIMSEFVLLITKAVQALTSFLDGPLGSSVATLAMFTGALGSAVLAGRLFMTLFGNVVVQGFMAFGSSITHAATLLGAFTLRFNLANKAVMGLAAAFSSIATVNPVIAAIGGVAAALGGLYTIFKLTENTEDRMFRKFQRQMKERREQIGLLRTAMIANENVTDNDQRMRNNVYIANRFPDISSAIMAAQTREETEAVLAKKLEEVEDVTIELTRQSMERIAVKLEELQTKRARMVGWYKGDTSLVDLAGLGLDDEDIEDINTRLAENLDIDYIQGANAGEFEEYYAELASEIQKYKTDLTTSFNSMAEVARSRADSIIKSSMGMTEELDADKVRIMSDIFKTELDAAVGSMERYAGAGNKVLAMLSALEVASYEYEHSVAVSEKTVDSMTASMQAMGVKGADAIVNMYKTLGDKHLGKLFLSLKAFTKEYNKISGGTGTQQEKEAALAELRSKYYDKWLNDIATVHQSEIDWSERARNREVELIKQSGASKEEQAKAIDEVNRRYYADQEESYKRLIQAQLIMLETLYGVKFPAQTIDFVLRADLSQLPPQLRNIIETSGVGSSLDKYLKVSANKDAATIGTLSDKRFGTVAKNTYDARKNEIDTDVIKNDIAYERGALSYAQYVEAKIAADAKLLEARKKYLADLEGDPKARDNQDRIKEERAAIAEMEQKQTLDAIKRRREAEKQSIELTRDQSLASIAEVDSELRRSDMNAMDRDEQLLANEETRIRIVLASLREELALGGNKEEQERKLLEIQEKELELAENIAEQRRLAYANRTKYIEQEYKYGLQTQSAYRENIRKQMAEGTVNPYDAQKQLWLDSNDPFDGYKHGIASIAESTKTMNEYISEGVQNFRDEWHSAMDEFVDSWWDGTKSAKDIFGDFVNNLARDWTKKLLQMYSDEVFAGFAKKFLGGNNGWLSDNYMNYGGGRTPSIGIVTPAIAEAATPTPSTAMGVDTTGLQLSLNSTLQNIQTNLGATSTSVASDVATMADESTQLLTGMADGASNLWSFLANGFSGLWSNIGSGISGILSTIAFATTSSSGGSFWERWLGNSIGMGFKLLGTVGGSAGGGSGGGVGSSLQLSDSFKGISDIAKNGIQFAKGGAFKGLSEFSNSIVSSPTLFTYGEHLKAFANGGVMGEAGPEAIMPLTRDSNGRLGVSAEGMGGAQCINNIYIETPEGYTAEQKSRVSNNNGGEDIMFTIVKQTAANVAQPGSPMYRAMQNTFGASQVLTSR